MTQASPQVGNIKPPLSPYLVLVIAIVVPGFGQAINNAPLRGVLMVCFMFILGMVTYQMAAPNISLMGHLAGGLFIYAFSVMDAYYWAKYRMVLFNRKS